MGAPKGRIPWNKGKTKETDFRIKPTNTKYDPIDEVWLIEQYITLKRGTPQIAKDLNVSPGFVYSYLKKYNIPIRSISEANKGITKSEEHKRKLSEIASKRIVSEETKEKHQNYKPTEETKQKISEAVLGKFVSDRTREKISASKIGHKVSEEMKIKSSTLNSGNNHVKFGLIIEKILCNHFKDTNKMPYGNPGFDFYCSKMYKIDGKGSLKQRNNCWTFYIDKNIIADYFACIACIKNELGDIIPTHFWLIPGNEINDRNVIVIRDAEKSLLKWKHYEQPLDKVVSCCQKIKQQL
jgi:predicted transcriptional regulator